MIANGFDVAIVEDHVNSNPFQNTYSLARWSYYGGGGTPNAWFDGVTNSLGGLSSGSMYSYYVPKVNQRIAVPSDFTISINGFHSGNDFTVVVTTEKVASYSGTNLVLQFTLTESHIPHTWGTLTEADNVNRFMAPNENGTPLDFSSGNSQSTMLEFTADNSWVLDNCEFVVWVQDNSTKEILQGTKVAVPDLLPLTYYNAGCNAINMVPLSNCEGEVSPTVTISNNGASALTTLDINYKVNNETVNTYNWTGNLGYGETEMVDLPAVAFEVQDENNLMVYSTNPSGNPDEDTSNDTTNTLFSSAPQVVPNIYLYLKLDDNPGETTYELKNSSGQVLYSGGPYATPQLFIKDTFALTQDDCYTFAIYDQGGDGLADGSYYMLRQSNFSVIYENYEFSGTEELYQFEVDLVGMKEQTTTEEFNIFPNPFNDFTNIQFNLNKSQNVEAVLYNVIGEAVYNSGRKQFSAGSHTLTINGSGLNPGIYFVNLKLGDKILTRKITIN